MSKELTGHKIAFLTKRGVEQPELTEPWKAIEEAGGEPVLVSDEPGTIIAMVGDWDHGDEFKVDVTLDEANPDDYLALVLPGGTINSDKIRSMRRPRPSSRHSWTPTSQWPPSATARGS